MQILDNVGSLELIDIMGNDLAIVNAARISYLGESKGDVADKKLLFYLMKNNHTSPFEMVEFKFKVKAPLFVVAQWVRHRNWNYNFQSFRYTNASDVDFYFPEQWRMQAQDNKQMSDGILTGQYDIEQCNELLSCVVDKCLDAYDTMIALGISREMARMILPQNMYTEFISKVDAHNLMHFLKLRMHSHAQWEIQQYANVMFSILEDKLPWTAEAFKKYKLEKELEGC